MIKAGIHRPLTVAVDNRLIVTLGSFGKDNCFQKT